MTRAPAFRPPTPTEHKVMLHLDRGLTRQETARRLGMTGTSGVDFHLRNLFRKCRVHSIRELLVIARAEGWVGNLNSG